MISKSIDLTQSELRNNFFKGKIVGEKEVKIGNRNKSDTVGSGRGNLTMREIINQWLCDDISFRFGGPE